MTDNRSNTKIQTRDIDCPFCDSGEVQIEEHNTSEWNDRGRSDYYVSLTNDECPSCGKTKREIKKKLKKKGYPFKR